MIEELENSLEAGMITPVMFASSLQVVTRVRKMENISSVTITARLTRG